MPQMQRVTELGFADFVAMLLVETLDAIVASHTSQEDRLRALATAADEDADTFAESITDDVLEATLARLFPTEDGGTALAEGMAAPSPEDLQSLGVTLTARATEGSKLTAAGVQEVREGVRRHLARTHQESLQEVARAGVPRVRVDGGVLRSKLTFSAMRRTEDDETPRDDAAPVTPTTVSALTTPLSARYVPLLQRGVIDSIARTRLTVTPAVVAGGGGGSTSPTEQASATIYGEVEIHFHTER